MKYIVTLTAPTTVNNELRHPVEGPLTVSEAEAERLFENGLVVGEPEEVEDPVADDDTEDLDKMSVAELHILVTKEGVALNDATKKADIIAAIEKHRADRAA